MGAWQAVEKPPAVGWEMKAEPAKGVIFLTPGLMDFSLQITGNEVGMRGDEERQEAVFVLDSLKDRVPAGHPLRRIRCLVDTALADLDSVFAELYAQTGRPRIPPKCLLRASLLRKLYGIPSERKLCEHLEFNLLFRWFVGLPFFRSRLGPLCFLPQPRARPYPRGLRRFLRGHQKAGQIAPPTLQEALLRGWDPDGGGRLHQELPAQRRRDKA